MTEPADSSQRTRLAWGLALGFVVLTLAGLIAIPMLVQRRVDRERAYIQTSEPARTLLMGLQFNLVREMSSLYQFAASGDTARVTTFRQARAVERQIWNDLAPLANRLGPEVYREFTAARTVTEIWHERVHEDEMLQQQAPASVARLQRADVQRQFEDVLRATDAIDDAIINTTRLSRTRIGNAERFGMRLSLLSVALAALAAGVVGALVARMRRLAFENERRRDEAARALAESARQAEARQRLLRGITHDVKNPLGAARGYAELLNMGLKGPLNTDQEKLVHGVERSIDGALAIISDLLDLARADSGGISIERINVDLNDVARQAAEDHRAAAVAAGHVIELRCAESGLDSYTDPVRVRQVIDNLISNAIKYTPKPGRIIIETDPSPQDTPFEATAVAIRVLDNGPGIPADQRERIFDEFTRVDDNNRALKGHGLGLAIARRMARLLGGELGLGERTEGSAFVLWLPQRRQIESQSGSKFVS